MTDTAATPAKSGVGISGALHRLLAFSGLIALVVVFSLASPNFMQTQNVLAILQATSVNGVLAIAATLVIITGGIDLSVGTLMTFCAVIPGVVLTFLGMPLPLGIVASILAGAGCGLVSGVVIAKLKVPPFIATLGMMLILFAVAILAAFVLSKTALGRYTFALGSNEEAVRLSGVNVDRWKIAVYAMAGAICGVAGLLIASRLNSAQPALGQGYELDAIAAVVIGGTSLSGGRGTVLGTLIGALIISVLANGLRILSVAQEWQTVVTGSIIILAVYADILRRRTL